MLIEFKTSRCVARERAGKHDHRCCPFFHGERDRRREVFVHNDFVESAGGSQPSTFRYRAEPCEEQFDEGQCTMGDSCTFCHTTAELLYHPDVFRKRLCIQGRFCKRGPLCAFAHSREELLVPCFSEYDEQNPTEDFIAWQFKTQWCPIGGQHDWETCVYAHTYRDWRRTPALGYSSWPCAQWAESVKEGANDLSYESRCALGLACPLAHGAKEQLYHPQFYKTSPCSENNCKRGPLCAFTHRGLRDARAAQPSEPPGEGPLPWAEETLAAYQPLYWAPPKYHTADEIYARRAMAQRGQPWHPDPEMCAMLRYRGSRRSHPGRGSGRGRGKGRGGSADAAAGRWGGGGGAYFGANGRERETQYGQWATPGQPAMNYFLAPPVVAGDPALGGCSSAASMWGAPIVKAQQPVPLSGDAMTSRQRLPAMGRDASARQADFAGISGSPVHVHGQGGGPPSPASVPLVGKLAGDGTHGLSALGAAEGLRPTLGSGSHPREGFRTPSSYGSPRGEGGEAADVSASQAPHATAQEGSEPGGA